MSKFPLSKTASVIILLASLLVIPFLLPDHLWAGPDGSESDPWEVYTLADLQKVGSGQDGWGLGDHYLLMNNIDAADTTAWNGGAGFEPVGTEAEPFVGVFNGAGYLIRDLYINRPGTDHIGLFGYADADSEIKRLGLENCNIEGNTWVGCLAGHTGGTVLKSYSTGSVSGYSVVGGLIGRMSAGSSVYESYSNSNVTGGDDWGYGGLVGIGNGLISNSHATGHVTSDGDGVGSLAGLTNGEPGTILKSYATGVVTADSGSQTGGLVGNSGPVEDSFWNIETAGSNSYSGGTGKTTAELKDITTYTDLATDGLNEVWDLVLHDSYTDETWTIDQGQNYPQPGWQWQPRPSARIEGDVRLEGNVRIEDGPPSLTIFSCGDNFTDERDGTTYATIEIDNQCWLAENLKYLPEVHSNSEFEQKDSDNQPGYGVYGYDGSDVATAKAQSNYDTYGVLYNWWAVMEGAADCNGLGAPPNDTCSEPVQGACPDGWYVPSHYEITTLERYLCAEGGHSNCETEFPYDESTTGYRGTDEGSALAGEADLWGSGGLKSHARFGESGFEARPAGNRWPSGSFYLEGSRAHFWSSSVSGGSAWRRYLYWDYSSVSRSTDSRGYGYSLRCLRE